MSRIVVHIDRLILTGIDVANREQLESALRETLTASLATPGAAERIGMRSNVAKLNGLSVSLDTGGRHTREQLGTRLGESLARSLQR